MNNFEIINDEALDEVTGGLSFDVLGVSLDASIADGISVTSDFASLSVPGPLTIAENIFTQATGAISDLLTGFGSGLTKLGQLFDFS